MVESCSTDRLSLPVPKSSPHCYLTSLHNPVNNLNYRHSRLEGYTIRIEGSEALHIDVQVSTEPPAGVRSMHREWLGLALHEDTRKDIP